MKGNPRNLSQNSQTRRASEPSPPFFLSNNPLTNCPFRKLLNCYMKATSTLWIINNHSHRPPSFSAGSVGSVNSLELRRSFFSYIRIDSYAFFCCSLLISSSSSSVNHVTAPVCVDNICIRGDLSQIELLAHLAFVAIRHRMMMRRRRRKVKRWWVGVVWMRVVRLSELTRISFVILISASHVTLCPIIPLGYYRGQGKSFSLSERSLETFVEWRIYGDKFFPRVVVFLRYCLSLICLSPSTTAAFQ